ncbi:rod shape-determining protein MreC [Neisseria sp. HSC-16F19]|nr:rod shape-determining protein MreC [Neisseria sp. HSC-16F19]MCP2040658.1 rod shape-determining protein MreC [Neisseria sp. HSC-16F19]
MAEQSLNFVHQRIRPASKLVVFVILSVALLVLDNRYAAVQQAKSHIATALYPLQWLAHKPVAAVNATWSYLQQQHDLIEERQNLLEHNARLQLQVRQQQAQLQALGGLTAVSGLQQNVLPQAILAEVISTGKNPSADKIFVNVGSRNGIRAGDAVTDENGLIGQVSAAQPFSAEIALLANSQAVIPVMVARTGVRTLVYGRTGGVALPYFPADASLQPGDVLVTSGLDSVYPAGIPVAEVAEVDPRTGSPYYQVALKPAADYRQVRFLLVIPQQADPAEALAAQNEAASAP